MTAPGTDVLKSIITISFPLSAVRYASLVLNYPGPEVWDGVAAVQLNPDGSVNSPTTVGTIIATSSGNGIQACLPLSVSNFSAASGLLVPSLRRPLHRGAVPSLQDFRAG